jgi:hypothetical protein
MHAAGEYASRVHQVFQQWVEQEIPEDRRQEVASRRDEIAGLIFNGRASTLNDALAIIEWRNGKTVPPEKAREQGRQEGFSEAVGRKRSNAASNLTSAAPPRTGRMARPKYDFDTAFDKAFAETMRK